jgi:glucose-1-phosphate adenylyltransferase
MSQNNKTTSPQLIKMICLILGGGAGTRLYPLTKDRSKPAVPVAGKYRLIDIAISNCINNGIKRMFVLTQFNSASLNQHIKNTYNFDNFNSGFVDIIAAEQTPSNKNWFQGTADAVRQTLRHMDHHDYDYVMILSGDQLYQMDLRDMANQHVQSDADISIATIPVNAKDATGFGIMKVNQNGFIESFIEKPKSDVLPAWTSPVSERDAAMGRNFLASMGIYIFSKRILKTLFDNYPDATDFGKEIIPKSIVDGLKVASYSYSGYWTDIGTIASFYEANLALAMPLPAFNLFDNDRMIYTRARMLPPAKISGTTITHAIISEGSIIHAERIEDSVIGVRSRIGKGAIIERSIIMGNDRFQTLQEIVLHPDKIPMGVGEGSVIERAILDKDCSIGKNVIIRGAEHLADTETETYCIVDGIVVVKKGAVIPDGSRIGDCYS